MSSTKITTKTSSKIASAVQNRKVSVPISMPQNLLADIDSIRGDTPRSVFVCKILRVEIKKRERREEINSL
jgi:metal-responsive CopG/Arc/MetJ family transcriptional regulator